MVLLYSKKPFNYKARESQRLSDNYLLRYIFMIYGVFVHFLIQYHLTMTINHLGKATIMPFFYRTTPLD